ncbi:MAG: Holliday junction branch migration protein RuvA [Flavobacteriales bacterium]|nr:Holliday junction branch migration protein RuvA [Flavobacteriales bacterium]
MIEFVEGKVEEISPTHVVLNANGIGYHIHITLPTFERIQGKTQLRLLTHLAIKEDSHTLYGFYEREERNVYLNLIAISGIGHATARMVLSSLDHKEFVSAILNANVPLLKSIKGIGPKAAQRMIIELQDKFSKLGEGALVGGGVMGQVQEALDALMALGFARAAAEKALSAVRKNDPDVTGTEELIKKSLKLL